MGADEGLGWAPNGAPLDIQRDDHWRHFDNSVNAVSFGFVATAILISMFLVMAIFERFLRPTSSSALTPSSTGRRHHRHHPHNIDQSRIGFTGKLLPPSPKVSVNAREVSVLMPGENIPTFIAHPAPVPVPCPRESVLWPPHQHYAFQNCIRNHNPTSTTSGSI